MSDLEFVMKPRNEEIGRLVQECADGKLSFRDLCKTVATMGYGTNSLYEMVRATPPTPKEPAT